MTSIAQNHDTGDLHEVTDGVLGIFAKLPQCGTVKTRLAAETSPQWAADVARAFLLDWVRRLARLPIHRILAFSPAEARYHFAGLVPDEYELVPQAKGDLGHRMHSFFADCLARFNRVVLIGTDSPTLPLQFIERAFQLLSNVDVVFGPATDGGYYLLGCARRLPPIFTVIEWSSPFVLAQSIEQLKKLDWRIALLPPWYDVDTLADWHMLVGHLAALELCGEAPGLPQTLELIKQSTTRMNKPLD